MEAPTRCIGRPASTFHRRPGPQERAHVHNSHTEASGVHKNMHAPTARTTSYNIGRLLLHAPHVWPAQDLQEPLRAARVGSEQCSYAVTASMWARGRAGRQAHTLTAAAAEVSMLPSWVPLQRTTAHTCLPPQVPLITPPPSRVPGQPATAHTLKQAGRLGRLTSVLRMRLKASWACAPK